MNEISPTPQGFGAPVKRVEDRPLITGRGRFVDDIQQEGTLRAFVLRSAMGHARIRVGDLAPVRAMPGVRLVWTAADIAHFGLFPMRGSGVQPDGSRPTAPPRTVLVKDVVRHVGDPIAFIVADTIEIARDAAERIEVDYESLPTVVDARAALGAGAPLLWPERGSNLAFQYHVGDKAKTDAAFAKAAHRVKVELANNRVASGFMETRGAIGEYDAKNDRYTLTMCTQGGWTPRDIIAKNLMKIDPKRLRIITPDVGGSFGTKLFTYAEYPLVAEAARATGAPVKWLADRLEHFLVDVHGRAQDATLEMALDAEGRFLGLRIDLVANVGAYLSEFAAFIPYGTARMGPGLYDIPAMDARVRGAYTNTTPMDAYRGAGRPEAAYFIERLVDECAAALGMDPAAIRRKNFIPPSKMPYSTVGGRTYDTGEFDRHLTRALELSDRAGFDGRAGESNGRGRLRGLGIATYIEACAAPGVEPAHLKLEADGSITLAIGTQTGGQGHATAYSQLVVGALGLDHDKVKVLQGDTDLLATGGGTGGSRSLPIGGASVDAAAKSLADKLRSVASGLLEAAPADLEFDRAGVRVAGTDRVVSLADVAAAANPADRAATEAVQPTEATYPNGTHVCEVEIDPGTGQTEILRYTIVDDMGAVVNPLLLAGQIFGGSVQGIGQALLENIVYDEDGQLLTASFLDYGLPRADDVTSFRFALENVPGTANALGIKGAGEAGSIGSSPAVMNAIADALRRGGVKGKVDMPATPERVWAAIAGERR